MSEIARARHSGFYLVSVPFPSRKVLLEILLSAWMDAALPAVEVKTKYRGQKSKDDNGVKDQDH